MAKFTNCLQIINAMPQQDQDALLARLDELQAQGLSPKEAQLQAAIDVLAQVAREGEIRKSADRITDTPAFKRWFGDSQVVDEYGQPMVVYHATNRSFDAFDTKRGELGSHFGPVEQANQVADAKRTNSNVVPAYLSIEKPLRLIDRGSFAADEVSQQLVDLGLMTQGEADAIAKAIYDDGVSDSKLVANLQAAIRKGGYDGVVYLNRREGFNPFGPDGVDGATLNEMSDEEVMDMFPEAQDSWIAFKPTQIKSATGNSGAFDPSEPSILKSADRPQFYSQLQRAIEGAPDRLANMAAPAWKQWLTANAPKLGVKADEVEWSGIKDYLDLQGKAKLSKDELARYLDDSGVKVGEVMLGGAKDFAAMTDAQLAAEYERIRGYKPESYGEPMSRDEIIDELDGAMDDDRSDTKYGKYTLPGGENYRELLITLPASEAPTTREQFSVFDESGELISQGMWPPSARTQARLDANPGWRVKRETVPDQNDASRKGLYQSSHWDEPNILAHIRVNDRTDVDGNKVLFVEEIQSDWGQEGKKKGFKVTPKREAELRAIIAKSEAAGFDATDEQKQAWADAMNELQPETMWNKVPQAPFVGKTEGWLNLALKRIAMMAVEGGYDKVAFVNGEQSADRYDLSRQIESIAYSPEEKILDAWDKDRRKVMRREITDESQLEEYVGKEVAKRLLSQPLVMGKHLLDGEDIKVGGEGMKTFYDQIVPQAINKLLPKLGGEKLGAVKILIAGNKVDIDGMRTGAKRVEQPGFDVTDKMRETVGAGVPLFSRDRTETAEFKRWSRNAPLVMAKDALSYDFQDGKPFVAQSFHGTNSEEDFAEFDLERGGDQTAAESAGMGIFSTNEPAVAGEYAKNLGFGRYLGLAFNGATDLQQDPTASRLQKKVDDARKAVSQASYDAVTETIPYLGDLAKGKSEELQRKLATSLMEIAPGAEERMAKIQDAADNLLAAERELSRYVTDYEASKIPQRIMPLYVRMANPKVYDAKGQTPGDFPLSERIAAAKKAGHDGVVFKNIADPSPVAVHYVSFSPSDIKSATGNSGGFSEGADIRKSADRTQTAEFKRWFADSKVVDSNGKPLVMYHGTRPGNDITEFDESDYDGIYFTPDSKYAESFTEGLFDDLGEKGAIYPVYLSIQNPYVVRTTWGSDEAEGFLYRELDRRKLEAEGYDGAMLYIDGELDQAQVFRSNQIKSATGNNGEFDPTNPDIRKSAARPYFDDLAKLKITTNYQLGDLLKTSKKLSWWDRTVGTQYNLAQKHPEFKRVFDAVQTFINDVSAYATRAADMAQDILPKLETWRDIGKAPLSAADVKALRDPIFGGTLSYTRDEDGNIIETDDVQKAGVVFTDEELRSRFNLTDKQIDLYRQFRKATDQSITDLALSDMLRYLGEDGADIREQVMASGNVDVAVGIIKSHLEDLAASEPRRAYLLGNITSDIEDKAEQANRLMDRGYAPLSRFGQYTVYAVGQDGEQIYFSMFENERDANKMAREMREQYPDATVTTGTMSQESYKLFSGVTPETLALFGDALGLEESGIDTKSEAYQTMLKVAKTNRSAMKRLIQRKGIDGFSEDAGRVLAGFVYSNARQISTNLHAGEIGKAASSVKDGDVKDQAIRLMEYIQNPQEEAQAIRGLLFTQFIGGSVASAMVNMTQPFTMTLPYLSQFGGASKAGKAMADALKLISRGIRNDDDLKQALKRAEDEGVVSPQEVHQLMAQAQGKGQLQSGDGTRVGDAMAKTNNFVAKLGLGWGKLFSAAEQFNRRITFIAAYKMAREQGIDNPFAFAEKAIAESQGIYNKGNKPNWARGAVGGTLFTFKQYSIAYVEFLRRMWGNGPEGKKAVGLALAVLFMTAGLGGMPGADDLDDVIDGFAQRVLGKSFDTKQAKKEFFASILGQTGAEFVMGGLTGIPGAPIDISGRMGLGNLIPGTGILTKKKDYGRDVSEVFGPAGTFFSNIAAAAGNVAQGEAGKAVESLSPVALANVIKAFDMATMGMYRDTKGRKVIDVDGWEAAVKALGFQPASVKRIQDATGTQQGLIAQNKLRETEIADKWAAGRIERNPAKVEEAKAELAEWNRKNPQSPIKIDQAQINRRVQQAMMDKAKRLEKTAPKEIRQSVKQELERAN